MANNGSNTKGLGSITTSAAIAWPHVKPEFRIVINEIEGKVYFALDVSQADTIGIIHNGKHVEIDKKAFLQCIGLEW